MAEIQNPHDLFFKELLSRPEGQRDFVAHYLPAPVVAQLDLTTLEATKDSFVQGSLVAHYSDLLFRVRLVTGSLAYLYLLFEHKSRPDRFARLQLLRYLVEFWDDWHLDHPRSPLPPVLPVLFYHGKRRWKSSTRFGDLVVCPEAFRPYLPDFAHHLCDLSAYEDADLRGEAILQAGLLALKHIFDPDLGRRLADILGLLGEVASSPTGLAALEAVLRYLTSAADAIDEPTLRRALEQALPIHGGTIMPTLMEQWTSRARQQGIERGIELGQAQGEAALLLRQLERKFARLPPKYRTLLGQADAQTLLRWGERILSAQTVEEVFED